MDIDLLSKMISELIVDHDTVGLPGVGTFYTEVVPSTFSDRGYTINPPYRRLSFLPNAVENDLLVNFYSDVNGTPADMAREYIVQFLRELAEALKEHKTITLPGLGRLRATKENNFFFVADEDLDIYPEAFGLAPVSLKNIPGLDDDKVDIRFEFKPPVRKAEEPEPSGASAPAAEPVSGLGASAAAETAAMQEPAESAEPAEPVETAEPAEPAVAAAPEASVPEPEAEAPEAAVAGDATPEPAEPEALADAAEEARVAEEDDGRTVKKFRWWIPLLVLSALAAIFLAVFLILAHVAPDFIDSILYTPEELRIINY